MLTRNILKRLIKDTNAEIRSKHFTVRYTRYDRKNGRGRTEACVRGTSWVYACLDAAEQTYKKQSAPLRGIRAELSRATCRQLFF